MNDPAFQELPADEPKGQAAPEGSSFVRAAANDNQPTVISHTPPLLLPQVSFGMHPSQLGKRLEGELLGHFRLEEFIGGGGMGAVFRALDTMLDRTVAVKVLSTDQGRDEETLRRFKNEAQSAARLDHENIARVYYVGEDRGVHYIVFEHIAGINVRDLVEQHGPLPLREAVSYTWQVAEALNHASHREVVHRDIKPSNILITPEGRAKLVDMGLARLHQVEQQGSDLTASGVTLGTFDYISPEQARDPRTADVRSDLYSLGCTLFFMLTGRPPFPEGTVLQKLLQHQGDEPPDPCDFRPELPREVSRMVARLLAKAPEARYQEPAALIADLTALSRGLADWDPTIVEPDSALRRHAPWLVPLALLVTVVIVLDRIWSAPVESEPAYDPIQTVEPSGSSPQEGRSGGGDALRPPPVPGGQVSQPGTSGLSPRPGAAARLAPPSTLPQDLIKREVVVPTRVDVGNPLSERFGDTSAANSLQQEKTAGGAAAVDSASIGLVGSDDAAPRLNAADGSPADPVKTVPDSKSKPADARVVAPDEPSAYSSLAAACYDAQSGDVIELRYNGPLVERPLRLTNLKLTIRAGEGYQPRIVFQPGPGDSDPTQYPRSMLTINGGEMTLIGVHFELDVPREVASESWALIEARGAEQVYLRHCWLTVRNAAEGHRAYHQGVAFLDVKPPPTGMMSGPEPMRKERPLLVRLEGCIARGEAAFLRTGQSQDIQLHWEDGLLAASERLLVLEPEQASRRERGRMQVDLRHMTAIAHEGLALMTNGADGQPPMQLRIKCKDSIVLAAGDASLIEQRGLEHFQPAREAVVWNGERNFYEGFRDFWKITTDASRAEPERLELAEWQAHWDGQVEGDEIFPRQGLVSWKQLPGYLRPLHEHTPEDYALSENGENAARGAASDARDAGFRPDLLPKLEPRAPDEPAARESEPDEEDGSE